MRVFSCDSLRVLGICRGMQMLNCYQGGSLRPVLSHVATRHDIYGPLVGATHRKVNSFHGLGLLEADLGDRLEAVAWTKDGVIEAMRHRENPWLGIMWHPERDFQPAEEDLELILKHLSQSKAACPEGENS